MKALVYLASILSTSVISSSEPRSLVPAGSTIAATLHADLAAAGYAPVAVAAPLSSARARDVGRPREHLLGADLASAGYGRAAAIEATAPALTFRPTSGATSRTAESLREDLAAAGYASVAALPGTAVSLNF